MGNKKITCRENSKYDVNNRSLQEKPLTHEPQAIWEKFPSHDQVVCLLHSAINTENREPKLHSCTTPPSFWLRLYGGIFTLWVAVEISTPTLRSVLALQQHQHSDLLLGGCRIKGSKERSFFSPNLFKTWDSLHATALLWMKSHKTACQPGNGLAFTNCKL